jgi:hypothetical protein
MPLLKPSGNFTYRMLHILPRQCGKVFGMISGRKQRLFLSAAFPACPYNGRQAVFSVRYELNFVLCDLGEVQA